jgi:hypothetical protein
LAPGWSPGIAGIAPALPFPFHGPQASTPNVPVGGLIADGEQFRRSFITSISVAIAGPGSMSNVTLAAVIACSALIAVQADAASYAGRTGAHYRVHPRHYARLPSACPLRRTAEGEIVDCQGWRLRPGGWDNSCFNLDYLPSQFACSGAGVR